MAFSARPIFTVCSDWVATVFRSWPATVSEMESSFRQSSAEVDEKPVHDLHILFGATVVIALKYHLPWWCKVLWRNNQFSFVHLYLDGSLSIELAGEDVEEVWV